MVHIVLTVIYVIESMCIYMFSFDICYGIHKCIYAVDNDIKYCYSVCQEVTHSSQLECFNHILLFCMYICESETIIS